MRSTRAALPAVVTAAALALLAAVPSAAAAQQPDPALYTQLRWRLVGPFRGGPPDAADGKRRPGGAGGLHRLVGVLDVVAEYDGAPTTQAVRAAASLEQTFADLLRQLEALKR